MRSRSPKKSDMYKADRLWAAIVLRKNNGGCFLCPEPATDPHHMIPRDHKATRHEVKNGLALCRRCYDRARDYPKAFLDDLCRHSAWGLQHWRYYKRHRKDVCHAPDYKARCKALAAALENEDGPEAT
ncbi:hypothetical protein LCGC14_1834800 [marine sediment metagenome]|uniref:HNH nuclease domain-containing protein n=1 Tax=marine sediment metagenome TaxID=412755 RepID=A0A0F9IUH6_9ZZZZ